MRHMEPKKQSFGGIYRGVIENNKDPEKLGRVQVRIVGIHNSTKTDDVGIPTEKLPWAEPCYSLFEGSVSGYGMFTVPLNGSHVFIFFEGENWECPRYFATAPGKPEKAPDKTKGFNDPDGVFPTKTKESDLNRLSRNEKLTETLVQLKKNNLYTGEHFDEPQPYYAAKYPYNTVIATHSGLLVELDNTPDNVRLHVYHPSGSYIEVDKNGNMVFRNGQDRFDICRGGLFQAADSVIRDIANNNSEYIGGDNTFEVQGENIKNTIGNNTERTEMNHDLSVGGDHNIEIEGAWNVISNTGINIISSADITITAGGTLKLQGARFDINPEPPVSVNVTGLDEPMVLEQEDAQLRWSEFTEQNFADIAMPSQSSGTEIPYSAYPNNNNHVNIYQEDLSISTNGVIPSIRAAIDIAGPTNPNDLPSGYTGSITTGTGYIFMRTPSAPTVKYAAYEGQMVILDPNDLDYDDNITEHFTLWDLTNGGSKTEAPTWYIKDQNVKRGGTTGSITGGQILTNLAYLCNDVLEPIESLYPGVQIQSAFRHSNWYNNAHNNDHAWGSAADIYWTGAKERDYFDRAIDIYNHFQGYIGQLVLVYSNYNTMWLHVTCLRQSDGLPEPIIGPPLTYRGNWFSGGYEFRKFIPKMGAGTYLIERVVTP